MRIMLVDHEAAFVREIELPENVLPPECVTLDGIVYVRRPNGKYQMANGIVATLSKAYEIPIGRKLTVPQRIEIASTRWGTGRTADAKFRAKVKFDLPWSQTMTMEIEDARPIVLNGVWCADPTHSYPFGGAPDGGEIARRRTNAFCNFDRPRGSLLIATVVAIDTVGRLVVDIAKHQRDIGKAKGSVLSLRKHLLESPVFVPATWRLE